MSVNTLNHHYGLTLIPAYFMEHQNENGWIAEESMVTKPPKTLFKYISPRGIQIIENLSIRFTQPSCLNDPFELLPCFDGFCEEGTVDTLTDIVIRKQYRRYIIEGGNLSYEDFKVIQVRHNQQTFDYLKGNPGFFKSRLNTVQDPNLDNTLGILCLSENKDSILMWSHYTDSHKGFLIEFDPGHGYFLPPDGNPAVTVGTLVKVQYSKFRPRSGILEGYKDCISFITKSEQWKYEEEWRVFKELAKSDQQKKTQTSTIHLFNIPPGCIKSITMGARMEFSDRLKLTEILKSNSKLRHVKLYQSHIHPDEFRLKYEQVKFPRILPSPRH
ncbi:DUF2971 domain-containing protein [Pedosphaera parvula]|uniref:DUF2971 domain-containing protein n=1 Tax=Pedosphaera parvula (strain Ellin514) TaxID=320771 RepID=B9XGR2_PEDPL|nr:DUF2971 domain-containing protein [Pedosphaera parvula]EEF60833.1 conserved hypothetical protein [Pedosphaera parvula Ellin514]